MEIMERKDSRLHPKTVRLNRFLAMAGVGSRRKNDELIRSGVVRINGKPVAELGVQVNLHKDQVTVSGKTVSPEQRLLYVILNKPKDAITTLSDEKGRTTVMKYVNIHQRVYPIGRLDRNTTGVLLFTNDGDLAQALMHPKGEIERMYRVTLDKQIEDKDLKKLRKGVKLEDGPAIPKEVEIIQGSKRTKVLITMMEGRNREVRRMFEVLGCEVKGLDRVSFAGLTPLGLPRGAWRFMTREEIRRLKRLTNLDEIE
jgi:23S rRNA pseudouridine2605 synthase